MTIDIGDRCTHCGEDTSFGSGNFVNRIPSQTDLTTATEWMLNSTIAVQPKIGDTVTGYMCAECQCYECETCGEPVWIEDEVKDATGLTHHASCLPQPLHASYGDNSCACALCEE